jgi:glycosyltransferase involved in cell wall biosynthesis
VTYNHPEMLQKVIRSVSGQSCRNFEFVAVNDAWVDAGKIIESFDAPVNCFVFKRSLGLDAGLFDFLVFWPKLSLVFF